ncbi:hypothetical protein Fcan01_01963 [Folsomia candida]|uniref:Uncharacterized protein n=1 Tax=Folsomia candida TaxID=158441 RepID=A0A226F6X1_FOLCA|nr:hypothetical protein Fcan01_01963 [Folsomia candida]
MSHIILLLLWTLCYSGTGSSRNNDNGQSDTSTTSGNRNVSITASSTQPLHNLSPKGTNKLQLVTTVTTPIPNNEAVQKEQLKITVRSKLWSPYRNVVDDFLEENEDDERISTAPSTFSTGKSISTQSQSGGNEIQALNDEKMSDSPQKRPIISSIRHYRSRKSFVRTRKTPSDPSIVKSQSDLTAKSSHVVDLDDEEQGDQPFSHASTDAKVASGGVRSFGKLVEGKPSTKTGQSSSSTTTSSSGSISVETDGEMVYGIPYFISPTVKVGNTSTKAQKIDKLLLPKKTLMPIITSSNIRNSSISSSDRRIASPESYSTDTRYGAPVLQPTLDNKFTTKDSSVNSSNKARQQQISPQPTKKAKGGGGGGGKRSRGGKAAGTRKPEYADGDENKAPDDDGFGRISSSPNPSLSLDKRRNGKKKKIGGDFQHDAFRKVKEKTRKASRLPADIRDQSDYKSNYNLEPLSNDNDPMGGGGGAASPETQDQSRPWENLANNGGGVHVESEYFPNALDEGTRERSGAFKDDDDEASNPVESDDEYDHVATSSASPSQNEKPGSDIVTVFLRIVESQHTLGANCTRGTDFNLGDGVVDRYAQERFRLEAELTVNRANMLTRFWKYAEPKSLEDEYLLHAMVISLIEFDEDIFAAGNCYDENQYKNYTLFCPYGYREQDGSILVKDLSLEYPYLSNTSEWFYKARKDAEIVIKNYNQFRRGQAQDS